MSHCEIVNIDNRSYYASGEVIVNAMQGCSTNGERGDEELSCFARPHVRGKSFKEFVSRIVSIHSSTQTRSKRSQTKMIQEFHQRWRLAAEMRSSSYGESELWVNRSFL